MCGFFFLACSSQEKRIKELWEVEKTIKFKDTPPGFNEYDIMTRENGYDLIDPAD